LHTDEQLITAYQEGDLEAFDLLYKRHKNALYRYFYRQVKSAAIADELHQDVWMRIVKTSAVFNQQSLFSTWLFKIAHNRLIDFYRSNKHQNEAINETIDAEGNHSILTEASSSSQPDALLNEAQMAEMVLKAVDELPSEQRETFLLHEHSGLSLKEIANITQVSFESSKSRLRYAVKKLRGQLRNLL